MGRRKLTRILLEATCDRGVRNKQGETARDIAMRKNLSEILEILDECYQVRSGKERKSSRSSKKTRSKSKVRFEARQGKGELNKKFVELLYISGKICIKITFSLDHIIIFVVN